MSTEYNFRKGLLIYTASALLFIVVGIFIASGLSLPGKLTALQSDADTAVVRTGDQPILMADGHSPFVAVAARVKDAVVNISAESISEGSYHDFMFDDEFFRRFFGAPNDRSMPQQKQRSESLGSGFIISDDGYIVTNNHVVRGADKIRVRLSDTSEYPAKVVGTDPETDVALLKINADGDLTVAKLGDSDDIKVGDWAIAIGNPFPQLGLDRTVTVGVISATGRQGLTFGGEDVSFQDYIQTDASINRGNSGGPLVNIKGEVIGMNSAIASNTGGSVGIGFAIPINLAKPVIESLKDSGAVSRGWLGVSPQEIDKDMAEAMNLPSTEGVIVGEVIHDSPAEEAGFKPGDVISKFNDKKITDLKQFRFLVAQTPPKEKVDVEVIRGDKKRTLTVTLGDRREALNVAQNEPQRGQDENKLWLGIKVQTLTQDMADRIGLAYEPGVIITDVEVGSPADEQGLQKFDIILEVDGQPVKDTGDFMAMTDKISGRKKAVSFFINRRGATRYIAIRPDQG